MSKNEAPAGARSADEQWLDILADEVARIAEVERGPGDGWAFVTATVSRLAVERAESRRDAVAARAERDTALGLSERPGYREFDQRPGAIIDNMIDAIAHAGRAIGAAAEAMALMNGGNRE